MKKPTQCDRVLNYIRACGSISSLEAFQDLGITQVAARIHELKRKGYEFEDEWEDRVNRFDDPVRFKRYRMKGASHD